MLLYSEYLLRHSFISRSRLDVTSFVIVWTYTPNMVNKVLFSALLHYFLFRPSLSRHTWRACSSLFSGFVDFIQWTMELVPPVFLNLNSHIHNWSMEIHSAQNILFCLTGSLLLLTLTWGHYLYAGKNREEGHSVTNPDWNNAKNYRCFMWNKGRKTMHINWFTPLSASRSDPSGLDCSHLLTFYLLCSTSSSEALRWT